MGVAEDAANISYSAKQGTTHDEEADDGGADYETLDSSLDQ